MKKAAVGGDGRLYKVCGWRIIRKGKHHFHNDRDVIVRHTSRDLFAFPAAMKVEFI